MRDEHDDAVDKVLAALRSAAPPEGMEARIAQRLQRQATEARGAESHWRDMLAANTPSAAWWRGAISGAAAAMLLAGTLMFVGHLPGLRAGVHDRRETARRNSDTPHVIAPIKSSTVSAPGAEARDSPCIRPSVLRVASMAPARRNQRASAESATTAVPTPELGLTAQERALVRLTRTVDPKVLATLARETHAKVEAGDAAQFEKFFADPPALPTTEINE